MDYQQKWQIIAEHDGGGQGKVYRVCRKDEYIEVKNSVRKILKAITSNFDYGAQRQLDDHKELCKWLPKMLQMEDPANQFALKVLHKPKDARDPNLAKERIKREIGVMSRNLHSNLLELVNSDPDGEWFVSRFYSGGTLAQKMDEYKGDFLSVLKAIRPIVEGVAKLHKEGYVHRDIKLENIFVGTKNDLVLGDFGLVFFDDPQHTRISEKYQNVGSHDWMPGWAIGMRIEEVKPTFDVFSLGKVLWSMTSGRRLLRLWYFRDDEFNVEKMFPDSPGINLANQLFDKCIVERERNCLPDAGALLKKIDRTIGLIKCGADGIDLTQKRKCKVCGIGEYDLVADGNATKIHNLGFNLVGGRTMKIFTCTNCGNVQLFSYDKVVPPPAWQKSESETQA
ncbi:MAG: protein kinase family protein [Phycisphaerae bacterium]|nr:protein kinase family protein [Phycisphaerae bacterium]MDD5380174.1 protein kinase family protein [Phycisphaerae bacterium]